MNIGMENNLPQWLQKELDQFGVFKEDAPVIRPSNKYPEPTGTHLTLVWMPLYLGEEPPF